VVNLFFVGEFLSVPDFVPTCDALNTRLIASAC